jgi:hypothetical protein
MKKVKLFASCLAALSLTALTTAVCFGARAIDNAGPGHGTDMLYLHVLDCSSGDTLRLIGGDTSDPTDIFPLAISTGNLQIRLSDRSK